MDYQSPLKLRIKVTNDFNLIKEGIPETQNNLREFTLNMCSLESLSLIRLKSLVTFILSFKGDW